MIRYMNIENYESKEQYIKEAMRITSLKMKQKEIEVGLKRKESIKEIILKCLSVRLTES